MRKRDGVEEIRQPLLDLEDLGEQEAFVIFSDQHCMKYCVRQRNRRKEGWGEIQKDNKDKAASWEELKVWKKHSGQASFCIARV